jgi:succinoglycan biosynthesis protein ExoA
MAASTDTIARISVITPMRDERASIDAFVADLAAQDFDGELEVLVADGGSVDGSVELLTAAAQRAGLALRVLDNPAGWVSPALNACIREARGDLIVRLDCHSRYPADYLRRLAELAERTGAWNVGGAVVPKGETPVERAVACAMDSPFGGIGWTRMGDSPEAVEVDTVTFGAFRPEAFRRAGLFDEDLVRNQDDEFNLRLREAGGRIVLDPTLTVFYKPRGSLAAVWRQYHGYGLWKVPVMLKHRQVLTLRSLVPFAFVLSVAALAGASPASALARRLLGAELALYLFGGVVFAGAGVRKSDEPWRLAPVVLATFPAFHVSYGLGMARGWLSAARAWTRTRAES